MPRKYREAQIQAAIIQWARYLEPKWPEVELLHATMQPASLTKLQAWRNKAAGIKAGFPDLHLPVPIVHNSTRLGIPGLWIELKAPGKAPTPMQRKRIDELKSLGHEVHVCTAPDEALDRIKDYMTRVYAAR